MAVFYSPVGNTQFEDANGNPANAYTITTYLAGTTTPVATYTSNTGLTTQANPITLNSLGLPANPIWLTGGAAVKFVFKDVGGATLLTLDNISGVNDNTAVVTDEWIASGFTPTYLAATIFSVVGDKTLVLQVGRRLRTTNTAGLAYSTTLTSVFSAGVTTVTVVNDTTPMDAGLSAVSYGFLSSVSPSSPPIKQLPTVTATVASNALTLGASTQPLNFRSATLASGAISTILASPANIVVPLGATLGTVAAKKNRLIVGEMNVADVAEIFVLNAILGNYLDESQLITTTILDAASDSAEVPYSTTARTAMPFRIIGYVESTQAVAGEWATAPTLIQGFGAGAEIVQQVSFRAYQSTAQAVAAATFTKVLFQTENYDIGGKFANSAFTATEPGVYMFSAAIATAPQADGQRTHIRWYLNGASHSMGMDYAIGAAQPAAFTASAVIRMAATDYVELFIYFSVAEDTLIGTDNTHFSGHRIG